MKNLIHFLKLAWKVSPANFLLLIASAVCSAAKTILNTMLPMFLVNELLGAKNPENLICYSGLIILNNVGMTLLENTFARILKSTEAVTNRGMLKFMSEKIMNLEYSYLEDPAYLDLKERANFAITNQDAIAGCIRAFAEVTSMALSLTGLFAILVTLGPVLIVVLIIGIVLILYIYSRISKEQAALMQEIIPINRRFSYYTFNLAFSKEAQKDIRLYDMTKMITDRVLKFSNDTCDIFQKVQIDGGKATGQMAAVSEAVSAFSYGYVGIRTLTTTFGPKLSIGALTMYVSATVNFSTMATKFGEAVVGLMQFISFLEPYMEFMSLGEETKQPGKVPFEGEVETIEFRDVTFTYPKAEKPVLRNITFSIRKGEKISIVGLNGAGKSTLVKLICRMYRADSGEILINGRNIYDYEYFSYMKTISAVFQDYRLFNFTIAENVSCQDKDVNRGEINRLINEVGLQDKVRELPAGIDSRFGKDYEEEGIEMSGGQSQKIAIARALYKEASMVILDEPASALDPIAEAEIYEKFNSLVEDKTAIYISHRMSSSVFCDKILIIDGGMVADYDTHENLMRKTESLYYKLFMSQAENYKLEAEPA